jgi:uncharacterized protein YprB with RNaseH-like and TPR domain
MTTEPKDRFSRVSAFKPTRRREPLATMTSSTAEAGDRLTQMLGAETGRNRYGEHLVARQWYSSPEMCAPDAGVLRLLLPARKRVTPRAAERSVAEAADPAQWLFLDTETTGLAGGTGTYAFLVGLAWWDAGGLHVEQFFMRDHAEEHSVLTEIARHLRARSVLVTFNGKSFDWPLLETRFRMTRAIPVPMLAAHLDLLHPARQLWRLELGSVRLAELERRVLGAETLGWSRQYDIDSSRIPEYYFDYLRGGPAEPLVGVFLHNRMDLRGLAALAGRIFRTLTQPEAIEPKVETALELYGISSMLNRRGESVRARGLYERALAAGLPESADLRARHELARLVKREGDFGYAAELWRGIAEASHSSFEACEQLCIHYERRVGDLAEATRLSRRVLAQLRRAGRLGLITRNKHAQWAARFERRLGRLQQKAAQVGASQNKSPAKDDELSSLIAQ